MSQWFPRRARILPGPLKALPQAERRSPVPVTALALTSAAIAAGLLLMPQLSPRLSVDPTPMAEFAGAATAEPEARVYAVSDSAVLIAAKPAPAEAVITPARAPAPQPLANAEPEPVVAKPAAIRSAAAADTSLFQLDLLPVLQADGADLETGAAPIAAPQKAATKPASRRTAGPNHGTAVVATGGPTQP